MVNSLIKKTGIYFIGNIASKVLSAVIIPIYAIYVTPEALGSYDYLLTLTTILCPMAFCALWESILKFGLNERDNKLKVRTAIATASKGSLITALVFSFLQIVACMYNGIGLKSGITLTAMILSRGFATTIQYSARTLNLTQKYVISGIIATVFNFVLVVLLVCVAPFQEYGLAFAYITGQFAILVYLNKYVKLFSTMREHSIDTDVLKSMLKYSVPCVFNLVSIYLLTGFGRILIIHSLGVEANGQYAFAMKFAALITAVGSIFSMALIEEGIIRANSEHFSQFYKKVIDNLILTLLAIACIAMPLITIFYELIRGSDYAQSYELIPVIIVYAVTSVLSTQFGSVFMALGKTSNNMWTTIIGLLVAIITSCILVEQFAVLGVAIGLSLGSLSMMFLRAMKATRCVGFNVRKSPILLLTGFFVLTTFISLISFSYRALWAELVAMVVLIILLLPVIFKGVKGLMSIKDV